MGRSEGIEPSTREPQSRMFPLHHILHITRHKKYMALRNRRNSVNCCKCLWRTQKDSSLYLRITKAVSLPLDDRCIGPRIFYGERGTRAAIFVDLANLTSIFRVGCEFGASREFRNPDLLYTKQVLFPLSYTSIYKYLFPVVPRLNGMSGL